MVLLEVCVDSRAGLLAAVAGRAGRLEVCSRLDLDGLTPEDELLTAAIASGIPCVAMIRPRAGAFTADVTVMQEMRVDLARAKALGAHGFALGIMDDDREIDALATGELVDLAAPLPVTFHRAFDTARDLSRALDVLIALRVARVLTSGGARTAHEGRTALQRLVERAQDRITVIAGGDVRAWNARAIVHSSGVSEIHSSTVFAIPE